MTVFLDSNVFIYAIGSKHPLREPCQSTLKKVADGSLKATTSTEVVQEVIHVLRRRDRHDEAIRLASAILDLFPDLLPVTREVMLRSVATLRDKPGLSTRDSIHAATMLAHGLTTIVSADRHFDSLDGLSRIDPSDAARG
ncbi:MAG: type II toxin-antitoxin system VapC family toxin [Deltaproteobacteria bacterium]|nr:type II toxin-antitoxin system VapC family toxin [Deltaproteobacteria bacterium]